MGTELYGNTDSILIVVPEFPDSKTSAGDYRITSIINILKKTHSVSLYVLNENSNEKNSDDVRVITSEKKDRLKHFKNLIEKESFKAVVFEFHQSSIPFIFEVPSHIIKIIDAHQLSYIKAEKMFDATGNLPDAYGTLEEIKTEELMAYKLADAVITVNDEEKIKLKKELQSKLIHTVITGIEFSKSKRVFKEREGIVFFANFANKQNIDALSFFVEKIVARLPDSKVGMIPVSVIGNSFSEEIRSIISENRKIEIEEKISDITQILSKFKAMILPLRYGAGLKKRVLDSINAKTPLITSSYGAEGYNFIHNQDIIICDTVEEYIKAIESIYYDKKKWNNTAENAFNKAEKEYSINVMENQFEVLLKFLNL